MRYYFSFFRINFDDSDNYKFSYFVRTLNRGRRRHVNVSIESNRNGHFSLHFGASRRVIQAIRDMQQFQSPNFSPGVVDVARFSGDSLRKEDSTPNIVLLLLQLKISGHFFRLYRQFADPINSTASERGWA